jgi:hypothetical protein
MLFISNVALQNSDIFLEKSLFIFQPFYRYYKPDVRIKGPQTKQKKHLLKKATEDNLLLKHHSLEAEKTPTQWFMKH